jgi:hypothetical protein
VGRERRGDQHRARHHRHGETEQRHPVATRRDQRAEVHAEREGGRADAGRRARERPGRRDQQRRPVQMAAAAA